MLKIYSIYPRSFIYRHFLSLINDTSILNNFTHTKTKRRKYSFSKLYLKKKKNPLSWPRFTITFRASSIFEIRNTKGEAEGCTRKRGNDTFGFGKFRSAQESFEQTSYRWYSMVQQRESARNFYKPVDR